jgi:hypothetical protein
MVLDFLDRMDVSGVRNGKTGLGKAAKGRRAVAGRRRRRVVLLA